MGEAAALTGAVFEVDPDRLDRAEAALAAAALAVAAGRPIVLPTETVYGVACRPDDPAATARLFEAKERPESLNLPVIIPDAALAWRLAERSPLAVRLAERFWPGPLTLVLPRSDRSRSWALGDRAGTIALRVPSHSITSRLLGRTGPLAATSANLSGRPPLDSRDALVAAFGPRVAVYLVIREGASSPSGAASTVIDLAGAAPRVLRAGPIDERAIREALLDPRPDGTR